MTMFDLRDRVALVTGGSRGIGRAIALALARQGAYVAINYRANDDAANAVLTELHANGGAGELLKFDASDPDAITIAVDDLAKRRGALHIVVANAGIAHDGLLLRVKDDELARTFATNVFGPIALARAAMRLMMRQRWGRLIFVSSVVAESGNAGQASYSASKGALLSLTKTLAKEYGARSVTVNAVAPGFIETDMTASINESGREKLRELTPLGRFGQPDDVAAAVAFLASAEAGYITGQTLRVNGGLYV